MKRPPASPEHEARSLARTARLPDAAPLRASPDGEPMPRQLAQLFGPQYAQRLEGVRLHDGAASHRAAKREGAEAFASAGHVHFGAGAFRPGSREGGLLLWHELAHVALGHRGLNRQPLPGAPQRSIADLTNADFIAAAATGPADGGYPREEIAAERARRVALGHDWLLEASAQSPARLVVAIPQAGGGETVHEADLRVVMGAPILFLPGRVMTPTQLQRLLDARGIGTVRVSQLLAASMPPVGGGRTVGGVAGNGVRQSLPYVVVDPAAMPAGLSDLNIPAVDFGPVGMVPSNRVPESWRGPASQLGVPQVTSGEFASRQSGGNSSSRLLVAWQNGEPMVLGMDQFQVGGAPSLMATHGYVVSIEGTGGVGTVLFAERMLRALAMGQRSHALEVNPNSGESQSATGRERNAVAEFHQRIHQAAQRQGNPPEVGEKYMLNAAEMARVALAFGGPLMTPEMRATLQRVAAGDAAAAAELAPQMRRLAAGMQSDAVLLDFDTRTWSGRFQQSFVRGVADPRTPEFYAAARYGPRTAALRGGGYGAGLGGLLALPVDAAVRGATGRGYGDFWDRAPQTVATGAFGGGLAGVSNQAIVSGTSNALLNQGVGVGLRSAAILTGARAIPGGIGAAGAEILSIAVFEDREHSAREVTLRTGRAGGIGAVSTVAGSIFGAAATGAVAGSVAPGVGNAIGFVAGLITGVVVYVVLDQALPQVDRTP